MKKPMSHSLGPNHRQSLRSSAGEILWFDQVRPNKELLAQLGQLKREWLPSWPRLLEKLRTSRSKIMIIATVARRSFARNIGLLDEINRLNSAESSPRISCIYLLFDPHEKDQMEEYMRHGCQVRHRLDPAPIVEMAREGLRQLLIKDAHK